VATSPTTPWPGTGPSTIITDRFDAVVVGSGPNGLAAAVRLAEAGRSVLVLEAGPTVGGGTRSAELTLPGFTHDVCAAVHALGVFAPALSLDELGRHGLSWTYPDLPLAHPLDGGRAAVLHRDLATTAAGLGAGGRRWTRMMRPTLDNWEALLPQLFGPLLSPPRHPFALARFGVQAVLPASVKQARLKSQDAAALFGGCAAHSMMPLHHPLTASFGLVLAASAHAGGWPVATGGSQAVATALAGRFTELGGEVRTGTTVTSLTQLPPHGVALFDTNPAQLATIAGDALPIRYRNRLHRFRHGPGAFKIDYALDAPVPWINASCRHAGTVHVVGTFDELRRAEADVAAGRMPERPFVLVVQASLFDATRAPAGKHTLWVYGHVPHDYTGDATAAIERQIERFAPGFGDVVLTRHVTTPADLHTYNANYVGGDIAGGAHGARQLIFRPTIALHAYATPNPSLYLCSASTPPGAGVHGMCGWHAAGRVLASRRSG